MPPILCLPIAKGLPNSTPKTILPLAFIRTTETVLIFTTKASPRVYSNSVFGTGIKKDREVFIRQPAGNVLAYQEYWFRIQFKDGVGVGAAKIAADNG